MSDPRDEADDLIAEDCARLAAFLTRDPELTPYDCCECGDTIERERAARYGWHVDGDIAMCRDCEYSAARV